MPLCFVVDDHVDTREGFAEYLRESGFEVQTAADALAEVASWAAEKVA